MSEGGTEFLGFLGTSFSSVNFKKVHKPKYMNNRAKNFHPVNVLWMVIDENLDSCLELGNSKVTQNLSSFHRAAKHTTISFSC